MLKLKLPEPASQNNNEKTHIGSQGTGGNLENKQIKKNNTNQWENSKQPKQVKIFLILGRISCTVKMSQNLKKKMEKNTTKITLENYTCTHCHKGV